MRLTWENVGSLSFYLLSGTAVILAIISNHEAQNESDLTFCLSKVSNFPTLKANAIIAIKQR